MIEEATSGPRAGVASTQRDRRGSRTSEPLCGTFWAPESNKWIQGEEVRGNFDSSFMSSELGESGTLVSDVIFGLAFVVKKAALSILVTSAFARPATRGALCDLSLQRPRPSFKTGKTLAHSFQRYASTIRTSIGLPRNSPFSFFLAKLLPTRRLCGRLCRILGNGTK